MEFQVNAAGKRIYPAEFKKKVLDELAQRASVQELARKYGISSLNILNWRKSVQLSAFTGRTSMSSSEQATFLQEMTPLSEYHRILEESKNLRRSFANMTMNRDILKEAVDVASKKSGFSQGADQEKLF